MRDINRQSTRPLPYPRSKRNHALAVLTSFRPGKCVPVAAFPMLREDSMSASMRINMEMLETKEILMNPVTARVTAYVVPWLAFERFEGSRDQFDRSWAGQPKVEGGEVVDFFRSHTFLTGGNYREIYRALGLHAPDAAVVNRMYQEAYNLIWNFRAKNRSKGLAPRAMENHTLAPAFWMHSRFAHVVPDFDQAVIDGEIAVNVVGANLTGNAGVRVNQVSVPGSPPLNEGGHIQIRQGSHAGAGELRATTPGAFPGAGNENVILTGVADMAQYWEEMAGEAGFTVSLSNMELARDTQRFAKLRQEYAGHDDDWIIDMLMSGLSIPDQALKQPILLADKTVRFGQAKRYATDSGNLDDSAVSGAAYIDLNIRCPRLNTGGVVIVQVEVLPEQLWERQSDPFLMATNTRLGDTFADLPDALRDYLDPEKVDVVRNGDVDTSHASPADTFGYAPMNWKWNAAGPKVGGKFLRPAVTAPVDDARQRIWAVETANPQLAANFYICQSIHIKPFLDQTTDPFELTLMGNAVMDGLTQFGGVLVEATDNYQKVLEKAPQERIEKAPGA